MIKKHRAKHGKNSSHGNASKAVNKTVIYICSLPGVATCIPGKIRPVHGGTNVPQVKFQRFDGPHKLKCVIRLRNVIQEMIVVISDAQDAERIIFEIEKI